MILACPQCGKRYRTDPSRIPPGGGFVRCPGCKARIEVRPPEAAPPHVPAAPVEPTPGPAAAPPPPPPAPAPEAPPPAAPPAPPSPIASGPASIRVMEVPGAEPPAPEPRRAGPPPPEVFIRTDGGSYIARDLEEVRKWVLQGRLLREDLISHAGGPEVRADLHPLTRHFFDLLDTHEASESGAPAMVEAPPGATEEEAAPMLSPGVTAEAAAPPTAAQAPPAAAPEGEAALAEGEAAVVAEGAEAEAAALAETGEVPTPGPLPGGVRAIGVLDFLLSLFPALNPVGLVAAFGLLRSRAWGRALTLFWAATTFLGLVLGGIRYAQSPIPVDTIRRIAPGFPPERLLLAGGVIGAAIVIYLLIVLVTLTRRSVIGRFHGGGSLAAVLLALLFYLAVGGFVASGALKERIGRLAPRPVAPRVPPAPRVAVPLRPLPPPPSEIVEGRAFTADGLASLEVAPGWKVRKVTEGEAAKLGLVLEGERSVPAGTMRFIAASPVDLERQDQRFDRVDTRRGEIKDVEVVRRGEFIGRKVVTEFPVSGGLNGYIVLSLHDDDQGYQFRCGSRGPFFETIRPECEQMAASVLVSNRSAAPTAPTAGEPASTPGSPQAVAPSAAQPSGSAAGASPPTSSPAPPAQVPGPTVPPAASPVAPGAATPPPAAAPPATNAPPNP